MSDSITETEVDEPTAQRELEALEVAAMEGEPVTPAQLAEARERVTLAGLWRRGREKREEARQRREQEDARAQAKADVAELLAGSEDRLSAAEAAVFDAILELLRIGDGHNERIADAARRFEAAGIPRPDNTQADEWNVEGIDRENFLAYPGWDATGPVVAGGQLHRPVPRHVDHVKETVERFVREQEIGRAVIVERW